VDAVGRNRNIVPQARIQLLYEGRDISRDVSAALVRLRVTDNLSDASDDLDIELEDVQGRWRDAWYPGHGDALALSLGWQGQEDNPAIAFFGRFEIDELSARHAQYSRTGRRHPGRFAHHAAPRL